MDQQNQSTGVAVVKINLAPEAVFTSLVNGDGFTALKNNVAEFISDKKKIVADLNTGAGRQKVIAAAASVVAEKSPLETMVMAQVRAFEEKPKQIRANLKEVLQMLTDGASEIREPVTVIENRLKEEKRINDERIAAIKKTIADVHNYPLLLVNATSAQLTESAESLAGAYLNNDFAEFKGEFDAVLADSVKKIKQMAIEAEQREAAAAETARQLAKLAEMEKAEAERIANETRAQEAREAKERLDRAEFEAKVKAEADAKQAVIDAENARLAKIERERIAAEQTEIARQQAEIKRKQDEIESQVKAQKAHEQEQLERKQRYEQYLADWDLAILQYATWCENKAFELANSEKIKAENELFESLGLGDVEFDFLEGNLTLRGALIAAYKQGGFPV